MKLESNSDNSYVVFLNAKYIDNINYSSKEEIGPFLKKTIVKLKSIYNLTLKGFYEVNFYINKKIGIFIELNRVEEYDFDTSDVDLKIIVHFDNTCYFKTDNYDYISDYSKIKYLKEYYYLNVEDVDETDIIKISEFGEFIYGDNLNILKSATNIS